MLTSKPFKIIHIDVLQAQNETFFTVVEAFSKYALVYLLTFLKAMDIDLFYF